MSTRCQVKVKSGSTANKTEIMLYHHHDGYPTNLLGVLAEAYKNGRKYLEKRAKEYHLSKADYSDMSNAGKMAGFICKEEPDGFEIEKSKRLHGDIEWYYEIEHDENYNNPKWIVSVYKIYGFGEMQVKLPVVKGELVEAAKMSEAIENEGNKLHEDAIPKLKKVKA